MLGLKCLQIYKLRERKSYIKNNYFFKKVKICRFCERFFQKSQTKLGIEENRFIFGIRYQGFAKGNTAFLEKKPQSHVVFAN